MKFIFSILLLLTMTNVHAAQIISIVWPFGVGDTQAQYSRSLIEELNKQQNKYVFVFENRPGAGATIGARHVASTPNSILSASTAFFVRPNFYPNESHRVSDFQPLMTQCAAPMMIVSSKYKNWSEIDRNQRLTIGISGLGATSHLMALEIKKLYPNLVPVPYKGTREASLDAMAGHVDLSVAFIGEVEGFLDRGELHALGVTGPKKVRNIDTLESHGFRGVSRIVNMHSLIVPKTMPPEQYQELRDLVTAAARRASVQHAYAVDYCSASDLNIELTHKWFNGQVEFWKELSQGVSLTK